MRFALIVLSVAGILAGSGGITFAADGCSYGYYGQLHCAPGAAPGVPYGYSRGYGYNGGYYGGDPYYGRQYRRRDDGAAIASGIIGATAGIIASQQHRRVYRHRRHR